MSSDVGNSVSWPDYEERSEDFYSRFQYHLDRWKTKDSLFEVPPDYQQYDFDATLGFWKDLDRKRKIAKASNRRSNHKKNINEVKAYGVPYQIEDHQYDSELSCEYKKPSHEIVPSPSQEMYYDNNFEEVLVEPTRCKWNWTRTAIVGAVALAVTISIPFAYQYAMTYYYPVEDDCNCKNDGLWEFVTMTLLNIREPQQVAKQFFGSH